MDNNEKYNDIINLPHHVSKKYPQMSIEARSAQFAPFAALTGYDEEVKETGRLTNNKIEINDELKEILDIKLREIQENVSKNLIVKFTYFVKDLKKDGGKYVNITGVVRKIDEIKKLIILEDKTAIQISDIIDIEFISS